MPVEDDSFQELFVKITGTEAVTESQKEILSHETHAEEEAELDQAVSDVARHDELSDAVDSSNVNE